MRISCPCVLCQLSLCVVNLLVFCVVMIVVSCVHLYYYHFKHFLPTISLRVKLSQGIQLILVSQLVHHPGMGSQGYVTYLLHCNCLGTKVPGTKHELTSLGQPGLAASQSSRKL